MNVRWRARGARRARALRLAAPGRGFLDLRSSNLANVSVFRMFDPQIVIVPYMSMGFIV